MLGARTQATLRTGRDGHPAPDLSLVESCEALSTRKGPKRGALTTPPSLWSQGPRGHWPLPPPPGLILGSLGREGPAPWGLHRGSVPRAQGAAALGAVATQAHAYALRLFPAHQGQGHLPIRPSSCSPRPQTPQPPSGLGTPLLFLSTLGGSLRGPAARTCARRCRRGLSPRAGPGWSWASAEAPCAGFVLVLCLGRRQVAVLPLQAGREPQERRGSEALWDTGRAHTLPDSGPPASPVPVCQATFLSQADCTGGWAGVGVPGQVHLMVCSDMGSRPGPTFTGKSAEQGCRVSRSHPPFLPVSQSRV